MLVMLIVVGTSIPGSAKHVLLHVFPSHLHADKMGHALGFAAMGFTFIRSRFERVRPWHILGFALALGSLTEFWQLFIPGRTAKLGDVLIDVGSACIGVWLASRRA